MHARDWFLADHARIHAFEVGEPEQMSMADFVCSQLSDEQLREAPAGHTSTVWLLWHLARVEDLIVNRILRERDEVFDREGWRQQLDIDERDVGTGNSDAELRALSERVDLRALREYRAAVGHETRAWAADADFAALAQPVDVVRRMAAGEPDIGPRGAWLPKTLWEGRSGRWLLGWGVVGHGHLHLGEAMTVRSLVGGEGVQMP